MKSIVDDDGDDEDYIDGEDHDDEDDDNKLYEDNFSFCTDDASSSDEEEFESENTEERISKCWMNCQKKSTKLNMEIMSSGQRWMNSCTSVTDEITMSPLPPLHICYRTPDGKTRHCFALETLYKIAMTSNIIKNRSGETKKLQFLQPPHFSTPMEDDLIDQISCRFGRGALNIEESEFYKKELGIKRNRAELDYLREIDHDHFSPSEFRESLNRYMSKNMVGDIYCCPLCYIEAYRRVYLDGKSEDEDSDEDEDDGRDSDENNDLGAFSMDPMTILSELDGDEEFRSASAFCFQKLHLVKRHLRDVHGVDTSALDGNELFHRFKIRASDGLLQRYLVKLHNRMLKQGDMMSYWFQGHNQSYIYLRQLIDKREQEAEAAEQMNGTRILGSDESLLPEFGSSFKHRGQRIWGRLSAPYRKDETFDIKEFVVDDDNEEYSEDEEQSDEQSQVARSIEKNEDVESDPMEQIVKELQRRRKSRGDKIESDHSQEGGSSDSEEESNSDEPDDNFEEESDEDEWLKKKRAARPSRLSRSSNEEIRAKKLRRGKRKNQQEQSDSPLLTSSNLTPSKKRNLRILDSDDDSLEVI